MFQIDPRRRELAAEFKATPFGPHSGDLQQVLNLMRAQPLPGRYILVTLTPHREWALARLGPATQRPGRAGGRGALPQPRAGRMGHFQAPLAGADRRNPRYRIGPNPAMSRTILGYAVPASAARKP